MGNWNAKFEGMVKSVGNVKFEGMLTFEGNVKLVGKEKLLGSVTVGKLENCRQ